MRDGIYPLVPVLVHYVGDNPSCSLWKILILFLPKNRSSCPRNLGNQHGFLSVRRNPESFNVLVKTGNLAWSATVFIHYPEGTCSVLSRYVCNLSVRCPHCSGLALCALCKSLYVRPVGIHQADYGMTLVFRYAVVGNVVEDLASVR